MKTLVTAISVLALAAGSTCALAQTSTDSSTQPSGKDAMQQQMDLQKNKPSKTVTEADKAKPKNRPGGQAAMQSQMDLQKNKPSKPVDKNAKAAEPRPNASKMTPEERAAYRKDVVKEAKP